MTRNWYTLSVGCQKQVHTGNESKRIPRAVTSLIDHSAYRTYLDHDTVDLHLLSANYLPRRIYVQFLGFRLGWIRSGLGQRAKREQGAFEAESWRLARVCQPTVVQKSIYRVCDTCVAWVVRTWHIRMCRRTPPGAHNG